MEQVLTGEFHTFFETGVGLNTTESSGIPGLAETFYAVVHVLKPTFVEDKDVHDTDVKDIEIVNSISEIYEIKEKEWIELVGEKEFQSLDKERRDFLINSAGMFDLGFSINIKEAYKYSIFDNEA